MRALTLAGARGEEALVGHRPRHLGVDGGGGEAEAGDEPSPGGWAGWACEVHGFPCSFLLAAISGDVPAGLFRGHVPRFYGTTTSQVPRGLAMGSKADTVSPFMRHR